LLKERDVGNEDFLKEVATGAGLFHTDEEVRPVIFYFSHSRYIKLKRLAFGFWQATQFLRSNELESEVRRDVNQAQRLGISGVPFTVLYLYFLRRNSRSTEMRRL
jgi:hypothetical protein